MPSKSSHNRLAHIRDNILLAQRFIAQMTYAEFRGDVRTVYAVIRCLEIISEASRGVDAAVKARHPQLPCLENGKGRAASAAHCHRARAFTQGRLTALLGQVGPC
jgi:uncharacterized protein with HEPN domain